MASGIDGITGEFIKAAQDKLTGPIHGEYAECGRVPLIIKQKIQILKYWKRLLNSEKSLAIKHAYDSLFESYELGQINWCSYVKEADMISLWIEQHILNTEIQAISNILHESFISITLNDICNLEIFPKLRTDNQFKIDFILENYLLILENRGHQIALSKFRINSHNLRIESGCYETYPKLEPHERLCFFCSKDAVENENHFLLECSLYEDERSALLEICEIEIENSANMVSENKFIEIMKNKNANDIAALGRYVYHSMVKHSEEKPNDHLKKTKRKKDEKAPTKLK